MFLRPFWRYIARSFAVLFLLILFGAPFYLNFTVFFMVFMLNPHGVHAQRQQMLLQQDLGVGSSNSVSALAFLSENLDKSRHDGRAVSAESAGCSGEAPMKKGTNDQVKG